MNHMTEIDSNEAVLVTGGDGWTTAGEFAGAALGTIVNGVQNAHAAAVSATADAMEWIANQF